MLDAIVAHWNQQLRIINRLYKLLFGMRVQTVGAD